MKLSAGGIGVAIAAILALDGLLAEQSFAQCAVHRTYIQRDVVEPGVYEVERAPAQYGWVYKPGEPPRRVLLRPYKNIAQFQRPYIAWSKEHLTIVPEPDC
jgi:hypothetical protein